MKRKTLRIAISLVMLFCFIFPQEMDQRVNSIAYWQAAADSGFLPKGVIPSPQSAIYLGSEINSLAVLTDDSPDIVIVGFDSTMQSENSIFVNPSDNSKILNSNNSFDDEFNGYGADQYYSTDWGNSWNGSILGVGGPNKGDPATAIDLNGRFYVGYIANNWGQGVAYSVDDGSTWIHSQIAQGYDRNHMLDKNHLWVDNSSESQFEGNLYSAWMNYYQGSSNYLDIEISHSTDQGISWTTPINISDSVNAGSLNQGVNIQTGPDGEVYAVWAVYDDFSFGEGAIGFTKSDDGGQSFEPATRIIDGIRGIRQAAKPIIGDNQAGPLNKKNMRVNSFPVMAVDISSSVHNGNIYVVWSNVGQPGANSGNDIDIYLIKSVDGGATWTSPQDAIKINQDLAGQGKQHFFPWITCDPETGTLAVIFYDDRDVADTTDLEVYVAISNDAGETWSDFRISDVSFTPEGYGSRKYFGDYLGISSRGGKVYPVWTDNRSGRMLSYTSPFTVASLVVLTNRLEANQSNLGGSLSLDNLGTPGLVEYPEIFSSDETPVDVEIGADYSARTLNPRLGGNNEYKHHQWDAPSDYLIEKSNFAFSPDQSTLTAFFHPTDPVTITTYAPVPLQLHDPWYAYQEAGSENWIQPDTFRPLSEMTGDGSYPVFLNQNDQFLPGVPIYRLRAPQYYADENGIYEFENWTGSGIDFGNGLNQPSSNRLTGIVFHSPGASVEAHYDLSNPVNLQPGYEIVINQEDGFAIPPGSTLEFAAGTRLRLERWGEFGGTETAPITFQGYSGAQWNGIELGNDLSLKNMVLKNTTVAIYTETNLTDVTIENVVIDGSIIGFDNAYYYTDSGPFVFESGYPEENPSELDNFRLTNCEFINISGNAINGNAINLGKVRIDNCQFIANSPIQTTAISFQIVNDDENYPEYAAPTIHEVFDSLQILNNTLIGFESGIILRFKERDWQDPFDWAVTNHERVVIQGNTVIDCDSAIVLSGEVLVFSNHNMIKNSQLGYMLDYYSYLLADGTDLEQTRYRILNETIIGNGSSIGIYDTNPLNPDYPYQDIAIFVGSTILCNHNIAVYTRDAIIYNNNLLYDNVTNYSYENLGSAYFESNNIADPQFVDYANGDYHLQATSPAVDAGYADFDGDGSDFTTDPDDQDPDGTRMDIGAFYYPQPPAITSPLTISEDTEWYGSYQIDADVTVASGATLTILPGSILKFSEIKEDPSRLTVNGNLIANGLPDAPITFTSSETGQSKGDWYGIILNSTIGDNVTIIDNCIVEYSKYGVYLTGASPDITNNIIRYNTYGLNARSGSNPDVSSNQFVNNSYGTYNYYSSPVYTNNLIENNTSRGMYHYGTSTPRLYNNTIGNNTGIGIYMYNHADVQFGHSGADERGYNEVIDNASYGIYASYYCDPFLGTSDPYNQSVAGYNSIHDNGTYNLRTYNHSTAIAGWNWWDGETTWSTYYYSSYDTSPVLNSEPDAASLGSSLAKGSSYDGYADCPDYDFFEPDTNSECALWYWAHDLRVTDQLPVALWAWELLIDKFPESENAPLALVKLANFTDAADYVDLTTYLYAVLNNSTYNDLLRVKALELLIGINIKNGEIDGAYSCALSLLDQATCNDQERVALFSLIDMGQFALGKATATAGYLEQMKTEYPHDELTLMAAELMGEDVNWSQVVLGEEAEEKPEAALLPERFALHPAYPNPFNPITTIRYDLAKDATVQLNIYDITGRLVQTLITGNQVAGFYELQWNGRDATGRPVSSGLYLYRLQAGKFTANNKMLLLK